ncbi:histidine kinase [Marichromatium purpuratum 984]|uniref:Sensor protein FixL n=1 Tax=Marichromatium purpuratum 984 TaxID=765910 RepID=W0E565_MARPU|nr:CHASE domain-containing protein [Marichromatium purpuratum]AHF04186.1 histidine kinase [Marichromatium purpuratum 984]
MQDRTRPTPKHPTRPARTKGTNSRRYLAWIVLLAALLPVLLAWQGLIEQRQLIADRQFHLLSQEIREAIDERLHDHEQILLGGAGLFDASEAVSRQEWRTYVERLRLTENYPGILGVGYSQVVRPDQLAAHVAAVRAEGFPDYRLKPPGERALYTAIVYLEPFSGRNLAAFGYDMFSQQTRRAAMQSAVDTDATTISGKVRLVQETHGKEQAGFLMYVPLYRPGLPLDTAAERWAALRGFVYSPYRVDDLMAGILGKRSLTIDFRIYDGDGTDPDALMYDSAEQRAPEPNPSHTGLQRIQAYGRTWTLSLYSRSGFAAETDLATIWLVLGLGIGISLALFAVTRLLLDRRAQALALAEEMTARRQESEERFRSVFLHLGQGVVIHGAEGRILDANPAAQRILGAPLEQMRELTSIDSLWQVVREDGRAFSSTDHPVIQTLRLGAPVTGVVMGVRHARATPWRWIQVDAYPRQDASGAEVYQVYAVFTDITARRRAEFALRDQSQHTQAILDNVIDGIVTAGPEGTVTSFNPAAERIFGYTAAEVVGGNLSMLMPEPYHSAHDGYMNHYLRTGDERVIGVTRELKGRRKDGTVFPMELAVSRIERGDRPFFIGMIRDITERKQLERMKSELISTVSHELRTPVTSIRGALGLVVGRYAEALPEKVRAMLEMAERNSARLTLLIDDILDLEKIASGRMHFDLHPTDLAALARQAVEANEGYARQLQVKLSGRLELERAPVVADDNRMLQVFANLISNAVKYSPRGGEVQIGLRRHGQGFRALVEDQGPGIPDSFKDHIFQRFAQADSSDTREKGGTGLGLSITKAILERHHGHIGYTSREGGGTTFYFDLPEWSGGRADVPPPTNEDDPSLRSTS